MTSDNDCYRYPCKEKGVCPAAFRGHVPKTVFCAGTLRRTVYSFAGLLLSIAVGCGTGYILCGFYGNGIKTAKQVVHDGRTEIVIFCLDRKSCL